MNRLCTIFLMVLSTTLAEPPSLTYGAPSISSGWESVSSGYSYEPNVATTYYTSQHVGHIPSEGAYLDSNLLNTVKKVILAHENSKGSASTSKISTLYGPPKTTYGPPKTTYGPPSSGWQPWSGKVVNLHFDHPVQSYPVAYYIGHEKYAPTYKGWSKPIISVDPVSTTYGVPKW